ncbi:hypothetical protein [Kitasatospora sp. NPDC101183]|uniref:hypothetical protein n=1 Tax=Kitasatospora sp. NPDC101183 TaxID=3364100 RepID=UPI003808B652
MKLATAARRLSFAGLVTACVGALVTPLMTVAPAHAVGSYDNAALADKALAYYRTDSGGNPVGSGTSACADAGRPGGDQCKQFVNCVVSMVSGRSQYPVDPNGNYQKSYTDVGGVAVTAATAVKGDIIQMGTYDSTDKMHTAIVLTNYHNGTFEVVDANWGGDGIVRRHTWTPPTGNIGYYRMGTVAPAIPSGFNVLLWGFNSGQTVSGTLNLTSHPTQSGVINWLDYVVTGPNGYRSEVRAGGGATNYPYALNTSALPAGAYTVSMIASEIDGQNHAYQGGSFTVPNATQYQSVSALQAPDGTIALYSIGADGNLYGTNQSVVRGGFGPWLTLYGGGNLVGRPTVVQVADGRIALYARTSVTTIVSSIQDAPHGGFGAWTQIGDTGGVASDPTVLLTRDGGVAVYVSNGADIVGTDQATPGAPSGKWLQLSNTGNLTGKPAVIQGSDGRVSLYARTSATTILSSIQDAPHGAFGAWTQIGDTGGVASDPTVLLGSGGNVAVYVSNGADIVGTDQAAPGAPSGKWLQLSNTGNLTGKPAVIQTADGRVALYARTSATTILGTNQTAPGSGFLPWVQIGDTGGVASDPSVILAQDGTVAVYVSNGADIVGTGQGAPGGGFSPWLKIG